jgi:hypothetical protein
MLFKASMLRDHGCCHGKRAFCHRHVVELVRLPIELRQA